MQKYIEANVEAGKRFYQDFHTKGKIVMLNLLKFKSKADYTDLGSIKPQQQITGKEAYKLYLDNTLPELKKAGSSVIFYGSSKNFLIGPESEKWDAVLLVEHQSVLKFMEFARGEDYLNGAGHRTAALDDSRLLPISENEKKLPNKT
ncbi:DUF1330 domain-containing protein [Fulvivirgaceae bacterium BMA10]|uniref:DUF1330 domain-containing protein n=2 Tax=Splendidivirga corallicola TaxID=3051826 RepID=A0ABT8KUT0_9BACT|nr:DUF1330 domain-containing protein [Fulvivirgaceae bacterium BMA10]